MKLPINIIADTLNHSQLREVREHTKDGSVPMIHVSALVHSSSNNFFCPREFVLRHFEQRANAGGALPPKFALLYATGHFLGDHIVQEFMRRNPTFAKYAWGDWTCKCEASTAHRVTLPVDQLCGNCGYPLDRYVEVDLFNPAHTVIGHADLIFCIDDIYYVYEFKSIDRADVVFKDITEPLGDHLIQASSYYYMLKSEGKKVNRIIRFVYVDRSMSGLYKDKPYLEVSSAAISTKRLTTMYAKAASTIAAIDANELPERICTSAFSTRAKECQCAVSCFSRVRKTIKPIRSD